MRIIKTKEVKTPTRGTPQSAGLDFYVPDKFFPDTGFVLMPGQSYNIPSGIMAKIPKGHALIAFNKSGIALKKGLQVGACVVDEDYQGEIHLHVRNIGRSWTTIENGEKLVQFLLVPVLYNEPIVLDSYKDLFPNSTERGPGGFGSTGGT